MDDKGQTALEYILILAGAMLLVVAVTLIIRSQVFTPVSRNVESNASTIKKIIDSVT